MLIRSVIASLALTLGVSGAALANEGIFNLAGGDVYSQTSIVEIGDCGAANACCANVCDDGCDACCGTWGLVGEAEFLMFKYNRADGVRIGLGAAESGSFGYEPAYRLTLGLVGPGGFGVRTRYFEFEQFEGIEDVADGDGLDVNTYTIDVEAFEGFQVSENWDLEASGGIRYVGFEETMIDVASDDLRFNNIYAGGVVAGLEARRALARGLFYARTRVAVVEGNKDILNIDDGVVEQAIELDDVTAGMLEIAIGFEVNREMASGNLLFARAAIEYQNWWNFSSNFDGIDETVFEGASDVGFNGFTGSVGVAY